MNERMPAVVMQREASILVYPDKICIELDDDHKFQVNKWGHREVEISKDTVETSVIGTWSQYNLMKDVETLQTTVSTWWEEWNNFDREENPEPPTHISDIIEVVTRRNYLKFNLNIGEWYYFRKDNDNSMR